GLMTADERRLDVLNALEGALFPGAQRRSSYLHQDLAGSRSWYVETLQFQGARRNKYPCPHARRYTVRHGSARLYCKLSLQTFATSCPIRSEALVADH